MNIQKTAREAVDVFRTDPLSVSLLPVMSGLGIAPFFIEKFPDAIGALAAVSASVVIYEAISHTRASLVKRDWLVRILDTRKNERALEHIVHRFFSKYWCHRQVAMVAAERAAGNRKERITEIIARRKRRVLTSLPHF